jgi:hypothetical protein
VRETLNADIPLAADHFRYFAGCLRAQEGGMAEIDAKTVSYHIHEPIGVVGQIIPWNFPILMAAWKLGPALAAGNCVVLKPAEQTPASILVLMEIIGDLLPSGCAQHRQRLRRRGRSGPGHEHAHRQDRLYRLDAGRSPHPALRGRDADPEHRRARRQVAEHLFQRHPAAGGRVHQQGGRGHGARVLQPG